MLETAEEREKLYDEEIAPALMELGLKCQVNGLSMVAVVEWKPDDYGRTRTITQDASLAIRMVDWVAQAKGNLDGFIIALKRFCTVNSIDMSASMVMHLLTSGAK